MKNLDGRVAIVTGAGRGIGRSVAQYLAARGASIVVNDMGSAPDGDGADSGPAQETVDAIVASGGQAIANGGDIAETETGSALVDLAVATYGKLDVLVNVAGILRDRMIFNLDPEDWDAVIRVHLRGAYSTVRPAAAYWRAQRNPAGHFRVINFTSVSGLHGSPTQPNYAAAKMGVVGFTYSLANSLARYGVTANAISPTAATRLTAALVSDSSDENPPGDEHSPDNIAPIVAYIAGERSDWLTGRVVNAGGYEVSLYSNPEPIAHVTSRGAWDFADLQQQVERAFKPLADGVPAGPFAVPAGLSQ